MYLESILRRNSVSILQRYLTLVDDAPIPKDKETVIALLLGKLLDPAPLRGIWDTLDSLSQQAISFAYHRQGLFDQRAFVNQFGSLPPRSTAQTNTFRLHRWEPIPLDLFIYQGRIPEDMLPLLAELVLPPQTFQLHGVSEPPELFTGGPQPVPLQRHETEWSGWQDLLTYLQLVDQGEIRFSRRSGLPTPTSCRRFVSQLVDGDFFPAAENGRIQDSSRPFAIHTIARDGELVDGEGLTAHGRRLLDRQEPAALLAAFERWLFHSRFDELTRIPDLRGLGRKNTRLSDPARRREALVEALSWSPAGEWIAIDDFFRALIVWELDLPVEESEEWQLEQKQETATAGGWWDQQDYWQIIQGTYVKTVLWEFLGGIGALDLLTVPAEAAPLTRGGEYLAEPVSPYDGLRYLRLNPLGAYLCGQVEAYRPSPAGDPCFTISAARIVTLKDDRELPPHIRLQLEKLVEPIGEDGALQLTSRQLLTAVAAGFAWTDVRQFLESGHEGELPAELISWLERLEGRDGRFTIAEAALLIRVADPALLHQALADPGLKQLCRRVDDTTLVISAAAEKKVRERLQTLEFLLR